MDYKHFLEILISKIKNNYPDAEVEVHSITKNNGIVLDGVVIREEDKRISPTIYLQSFYERVTDDDSIDNVISEIICMYERHKGDEVPLGVVDCISDFSEVSSNIYYQVINYEKNKQLLSGCPHRKLLDLAIVYRMSITVNDDDESIGSVLIKNELAFNVWHTTEDELYSIAVENTPLLFEPVAQNISDVLIEMMRLKGIEESELLDSLYQCDIGKHMMVVTNKSTLFIVYLNDKKKMFR